MGTSGAYTGSGGKIGKDLRDGIKEFLGAPPGSPPATPPGQSDQTDHRHGPPINPAVFRAALQLLRPSTGGGGGGDGPGGAGGGRGGGGPQRTAAAAAGSAGRAAAAAHAYATGDAAALDALGLNFAELQALGDDFEVVRRIVASACGTPDSTIGDAEQRWVAAGVAEWIIENEQNNPEAIVRQTIAAIITQTVLVESGDLINHHPDAVGTERDIRDAAEALATKAQLSVGGTSEQEITRAVEEGLNTLREILGGPDA
ncbi:hypothetical protein [Streptomyces sp. NPDC021020]|uniref:hypothetical protein n=1 Tax=Streptomyces sp. NPDC021020 TaxID=3365109 RepID=UPI0037887872